MEEAVRSERERIGHDLHDSLGAYLFGIGAHVEELKKLVGMSDPAVRGLLTGLTELTACAQRAFRTALSGLLNGHDDEPGLSSMLEAECRFFGERTGSTIEFSPLGFLPDVPQDQQKALVLTLREALLNVAKHAAMPTTVTVVLDRLAEGLRLVVRDCPGSVPPSRPSPAKLHADARAGHYGLRSLKRRLRAMGGGLHWETDPCGGTTLEASVPGDRGGKQDLPGRP